MNVVHRSVTLVTGLAVLLVGCGTSIGGNGGGGVATQDGASTIDSGLGTNDAVFQADTAAGPDASPVADGATTDLPPADSGPTPGSDAVVTPLSKAHLYFTGTDNKRTVDAQASFPATGAYGKITLHLTLACPAGGCDPWDRLGSLSIVTEKGAGGQADSTVELVRFITPYHVGAKWDIDLTDLRPLLSGEVTMRAFIDTWVGPGSSYGAGWLLTAEFEMVGGVPDKLPIAVLPLIAPGAVTYGDPAKPLSAAAKPLSVVLPNASSFAVRTLVTGHGQGNAGNCAEFCPKTHTLTVGAASHTQKVWRTDCATTTAPGQQGSYKFSRAGWCPGAAVVPWVTDVTADLAADAVPSFGYDVEAYENTCRPDATPCAGCTLGTSCAYDGGNHTEPFYQLSALLIAYW